MAHPPDCPGGPATGPGARSLRTDHHHKNLHNAIRLGEALKCPVELGYYGVVASQIGVQSLRQHKYMTWDRTRERIVRA